MNPLINIKTKGSFSVSVDGKLIEQIRKAQIWFTKSIVTFPLLMFCLFIDISNFILITTDIQGDDYTKPIVVCALAVAFEVAPLYIGYAICLIQYEMGNKVRKFILLFACISLSLGIVSNCILRFFLLDGFDKKDIAVAITMTLMPIITSCINLVVGCLSFDPILFDMKRLSKEIRELKMQKYRLEAVQKELENNDKLKDQLKEKENTSYKIAYRGILVFQHKFKNYINTRSYDDIL